MINIRIDGSQLPDDGQFVARIMPFSVRTDTPGNLAVGVAAVQVVNLAALAGKDYFLNFRNVSTAGQIIGLDVDNTVTIANAGMLLYPGESIQLPFMFTAIFAIADAAAGALRRWTERTA